MKYDPNLAPDPKEWLRLNESQRQTLVLAAHEQDPEDRPGRKRKAAGVTKAAPARKRAAKTPSAVSEGTVYQLRVELENMEEPFIWRRFLVPASITLGGLHHVLQAVIGWNDCHLHAFVKDGMVWEDQDLAAHEVDSIEEHDAKLIDVLPRVRSRLTYVYDFGDDWRHNVVFEKRLTSVAAPDVPICPEGQGACPPEDCCGVWGYNDMLEILVDPDHEEHTQVAKWFGKDFDPMDFDHDAAAKRIDALKRAT